MSGEGSTARLSAERVHASVHDGVHGGERVGDARSTACTMASSSTTALTVKQKVGLEMLSEALEGEFDAAFGVLVKVLGNLVAHPDDAKYRKLRTSNAKVQAMLATKGVRALLVGSGFAEEPDALNAETADVAAVQAALEALQALHASRAAQEAAQKAASMAERNLQVRAASLQESRRGVGDERAQRNTKLSA